MAASEHRGAAAGIWRRVAANGRRDRGIGMSEVAANRGGGFGVAHRSGIAQRVATAACPGWENRGGRWREKREKEIMARFKLIFLKIFNCNLKHFEY
jgi:hypothetical protein